MRIFFLISSFFLFVTHLCGQGVVFKEGVSWDSLLTEASVKDKLIFVDVYTDWCGPCKLMDKQVFSDKVVSSKMKKDFINFKLNAEKGQGISLARKYNVFSYPTYLFVNGSGTLIYRTEGYMPAQRFMQEMKNALEELNDSITLLEMDARYMSGNRDSEFMYNYIVKRTKLKQDNKDLLDEYCLLLDSTQKNSVRTLQLLADNAAFGVRNLQIGPALTLLLSNKDRFSQLKNIESVDNYISLAQQNTLMKAIKLEDEDLLDLILRANKDRKHEPFDEESDEMFMLTYYYATRQYQSYIRAAVDFMNNVLMKISDNQLEVKDKAVLGEVIIELEEYLASKTPEERERTLASYRKTQTIQLIRTFNKISKTILFIGAGDTLVQQGLAWMARSYELAKKDTAYFKYVYPECQKIYASYLYLAGDSQKAIALQQNALNCISQPGIADTGEEIKEYSILLEAMKAGKELSFGR